MEHLNQCIMSGRSSSVIIYLTLIVLGDFTFGSEYHNFDDTILFKIDWQGKSNNELLESPTKIEPYFITTANKEKYQCFIPDTTKPEQDHGENYTGPNPIEILSPFFAQKLCSIKLGTYWTYELCHGRHVRQYHEERDGKKVKIQEFELGTFDRTQKLKLSAEYDELAKNPTRRKDIPTKKIDGISMPYVEIEMKGGTNCDLTNQPRSIKVLYVCYQHGNHEIFSVKETQTCEYEAVVLSPLLCNHPDYKPQNTGENEIKCQPVDNAPKKPRALTLMEIESLKLRHQKNSDDKHQKVYAFIQVDKEGQNGETRVRVEIRPMEIKSMEIRSADKNFYDDTPNAIADSETNGAEWNPVKNFLEGKNCLNGGNGWWKYRFCYGKLVNQYHIEKDGKKTVVNLGNFEVVNHINWIDTHPNKKPKPKDKRKELSHFYSNGHICDKTGKPRQTEVKLKCVTNPTGSLSSVSLFLLEPKTCEYILGVESPMICEILKYADDGYGLLTHLSMMEMELKSFSQSKEDNELMKKMQVNEDE